ncbi:hypothetical protein CM15mP35_02480 [bacterium]|nr:MAG: hypothetical protein CM15mP35_02480 [bacterium]
MVEMNCWVGMNNKRVLNSKDNFLINSLYNVYSPKIGTGSNLLKYNNDKKFTMSHSLLIENL